jgi:hypothetical protein
MTFDVFVCPNPIKGILIIKSKRNNLFIILIWVIQNVKDISVILTISLVLIYFCKYTHFLSIIVICGKFILTIIVVKE